MKIALIVAGAITAIVVTTIFLGEKAGAMTGGVIGITAFDFWRQLPE